MDEVRKDIQQIKEDIAEIKKHVAVNTTSLDLHMLRTELNERRIVKLEYFLMGSMAGVIVLLAQIALKH